MFSIKARHILSRVRAFCKQKKSPPARPTVSGHFLMGPLQYLLWRHLKMHGISSGFQQICLTCACKARIIARFCEGRLC